MSIQRRLFSNPITREIIVFSSDVFPIRRDMWNRFRTYLKESWPSSERFYSSKEIHKLYRDFLRWYMRDGFNLVDYFSYAFVSLSSEERKTYISEADRGRLHRIANDEAYNYIMADKAIFDDRYKKYISRDWILIDSNSKKEDFFAFARRHGKIITKPRDGQKGDGIKLYEVDSEEKLEKAWREISVNGLLVEEILDQEETIARLHPESINTVRISTAIDQKGEVHIMAAVIRVGVADSIVDNGSAGGLFAGIDVERGIIISPGIDLKSRRFYVHPTTGIPFLGFVIPKWEELKTLCVEVAKITPQLRYIGWDWVYKSNRQWELLEGNEPGGVHILQQGIGHGLKKEYENILLNKG